MNKKIITGIGLIVVALITLIVVICNISKSTTGYKELELTYKTNGGVPYKWEYQIEDESIVEFVKTKDIILSLKLGLFIIFI